MYFPAVSSLLATILVLPTLTFSSLVAPEALGVRANHPKPWTMTNLTLFDSHYERPGSNIAFHFKAPVHGINTYCHAHSGANLNIGSYTACNNKQVEFTYTNEEVGGQGSQASATLRVRIGPKINAGNSTTPAQWQCGSTFFYMRCQLDWSEHHDGLNCKLPSHTWTPHWPGKNAC